MLDWIHVGKDRAQWEVFVSTLMKFGSRTRRTVCGLSQRLMIY